MPQNPPPANPPSLLLIDDDPSIPSLFQNPFSQSKVELQCIIHTHESQHELISSILTRSFDLLLLDGFLSHNLRGPDLLRSLLKQKPALTCIGFSTSSSFAPKFLQAGAIGFVRKDLENPEAAVMEVLKIWRESRNENELP